jgi:hypothetical protein
VRTARACPHAPRDDDYDDYEFAPVTGTTFVFDGTVPFGGAKVKATVVKDGGWKIDRFTVTK